MILELEDLTYVHGSGRGVTGFSARFESGRLYGILGPNGAGKSTLIRMAAGCSRPQSGRVLADSVDVFSMRPRERAGKTAFLPQTLPCEFDYTCLEAVSFGTYGSSGFLPGRGETERCLEAMREIGVEHLADRRISDLSGGELQKVMIAQTMAQDAEATILDEPISHLDPLRQNEIMGRLRELAKGRNKLVIVTIHDLTMASLFCDEVIMMRDGKKKAEGPLQEAFMEESIRETFGIDAEIIPYSGGRVPVIKRA